MKVSNDLQIKLKMSLGPIAQNRRMTVMMPVGKGENGAMVQ
jgi:hypothetical protein